VISSSTRAVRVPRKRLAELVAFVAAAQGTRIAEVDIAVVSRRQIASINKRYLGCDGPTDVLSFDLSDPHGPIRAQIVVCGDIAARQGRLHGCGPQRELMLYVVHGLLHLAGYDDRTARAAERMHAREEELLDTFAARRISGEP